MGGRALCSRCVAWRCEYEKKAFTASSAQSRSRPLAGRDFVTTGYLTPLTARPTRGPAPRTDGWLPSHGRLAALPPRERRRRRSKVSRRRRAGHAPPARRGRRVRVPRAFKRPAKTLWWWWWWWWWQLRITSGRLPLIGGSIKDITPADSTGRTTVHRPRHSSPVWLAAPARTRRESEGGPLRGRGRAHRGPHPSGSPLPACHPPAVTR